jgi:hypothetical protein
VFFDTLNNTVSDQDGRISTKEGIILYDLLIYDAQTKSTANPAYYPKADDDWATRLQHISDENIKDYKDYVTAKNVNSVAYGLWVWQITDIVTEARSLGIKKTYQNVTNETSAGVQSTLNDGIDDTDEEAMMKHFLDFIKFKPAQTLDSRVDNLKVTKVLDIEQKIKDYQDFYGLRDGKINILIAYLSYAFQWGHTKITFSNSLPEGAGIENAPISFYSVFGRLLTP